VAVEGPDLSLGTDGGAVATLVLRAREARDAGAFAQLIRRFEGPALALAYSMLGGADPSAAGDVVQEAFWRAWQRIGELQEPARFGAWLSRMVRNLAIDTRRKVPRAESRGDVADLGELSPVPMPGGGGLNGAGADPAADLDQRETAARIQRVLSTLDEQTRTAVVLRYYENLSSKQIGELLDLSPAAVDMRLSRARSELRDKLAWADPATNGTSHA
jgi:RNA polymerase sigma factor (sigma-70 family)